MNKDYIDWGYNSSMLEIDKNYNKVKESFSGTMLKLETWYNATLNKYGYKISILK